MESDCWHLIVDDSDVTEIKALCREHGIETEDAGATARQLPFSVDAATALAVLTAGAALAKCLTPLIVALLERNRHTVTWKRGNEVIEISKASPEQIEALLFKSSTKGALRIKRKR